jgi:hypothetical protein
METTDLIQVALGTVFSFGDLEVEKLLTGREVKYTVQISLFSRL